eukprot:TRINITY_DN2356_c0_g1_i2.p1 TRINITY_DN2356_c0_g1~~TRINITY_DN2356_c0_g1_i2.p1  ORF type:complete len:340 (+),score=19.68 TRINITY_DN2356_c0_g1_i2:124-1143(+)
MQPENWPLTNPLPRPQPSTPAAGPNERPSSPSAAAHRSPNAVGPTQPLRFNPDDPNRGTRRNGDLERFAPNSGNVNVDKLMAKLRSLENQLTRAREENDALKRENQNLRLENDDLRRRFGHVQQRSPPRYPLSPVSPLDPTLSVLGQSYAAQLGPNVQVHRTFAQEKPVKVFSPPTRIRLLDNSPPRGVPPGVVLNTPTGPVVVLPKVRAPPIIASAPMKQTMATPVMPVVPEAGPQPFSPTNSTVPHEMIPPPPPRRPFSPAFSPPSDPQTGIRVPRTQPPRTLSRPDSSYPNRQPTEPPPPPPRRDPSVFTPAAPDASYPNGPRPTQRIFDLSLIHI